MEQVECEFTWLKFRDKIPNNIPTISQQNLAKPPFASVLKAKNEIKIPKNF